jgi:hypothetical protein
MISRSAALLLLLLPAACAEAPVVRKGEPPAASPEEVYRKMEQRLLAAGSLRIRARCDQVNRTESGTEERQGLAAFCFLRGETQCAIELRGIDRDGQTVGTALVSDGTRMISRPRFTKPWAETDIPNSFDIVFLSLLHRIGLARTTTATAAMIGMNTFLIPSAIPAAANFRNEETKDGVACMSYTVPKLTDRDLHAKLWYDAKTLRPLRRTVGVEDGKPGLVYDETYEDYSLEAQIPDGPFVLPDLDPASRRRFASDGKSMIYEEREGGIVRFVLICDDGTEGETTADGIILRRGGVTQNIKATTGLMLIKGNRTMMNAIPNGWDHDLVQEYHEYRAAHPKGLIVDWLKAAQQRRPTTMMEIYLRQE